jgi:uncharacterized protein YdaT
MNRLFGKLSPKDHTADTKQEQTAAPIVQEKVHDLYENIDKTQVQEVHDRTEVVQTVLPVMDTKTEVTERSTIDHGIEVHEHGKTGLTASTDLKLAANREEIKQQYESTHDSAVTEREARPDLQKTEQLNIVEEIVPVIHRDIYRPHEIEHVKQVVELHHEEPVVLGVTIAQPISMEEFQNQSSIL